MAREINRTSSLNKRGILMAAAASLACAAGALAAPVPNGPVVSLQFTDGYNVISNSTWYAGVVSEPRWNYTTDIIQTEAPAGVPYTSTATSDGGVANTSSLLDSTGAASGITYSYTFGRANQSNSDQTTNFPQPPAVTTYDYDLAGRTVGISGSDGNPNATQVMLSGLNPNKTYDILAYVNGFFFTGNGSSEEVTLGSTSHYLQSATTFTAWVQSTATTSGAATPSNYVEFDGITGVSAETILLGNTGTAYGLGGLQIVPVAGAVPEPASIGLLGAAGAGLLLRRRGRVAGRSK